MTSLYAVGKKSGGAAEWTWHHAVRARLIKITQREKNHAGSKSGQGRVKKARYRRAAPPRSTISKKLPGHIGKSHTRPGDQRASPRGKGKDGDSWGGGAGSR